MKLSCDRSTIFVTRWWPHSASRASFASRKIHRRAARDSAFDDRLLGVEEKAERAARTKIDSQKKEIPEGTEEWDLLHHRYYAEELKKFGIDLSR